MGSFEWSFIAFKVKCIRNSKFLTISSITGTLVLKPVFGKITEIDIDSAEVTEMHSSNHNLLHNRIVLNHTGQSSCGELKNKKSVVSIFLLNVFASSR